MSTSQHLWVIGDILFGSQLCFFFKKHWLLYHVQLISQNIHILNQAWSLSLSPSVYIFFYLFFTINKKKKTESFAGVVNCFVFLQMACHPCTEDRARSLPCLGAFRNLHLNQRLWEVTICMSNHLTFGVDENNHSAAVNQTLVCESMISHFVFWRTRSERELAFALC